MLHCSRIGTGSREIATFSWRICLALLLLFACRGPLVFAQHLQQTGTYSQALVSKIEDGQVDSYQIALSAREFIRVNVEQQGVNLVLRLLDEKGTLLVQSDRPNGGVGVEQLVWKTDEKATLTLEVKAVDDRSGIGGYRLWLEQRRPARERDAEEIKAQQTMWEGHQLRARNQPADLAQAVEKYKQAIVLWRALGNLWNESCATTLLGITYGALADLAQAKAELTAACQKWKRLEAAGGAPAIFRRGGWTIAATNVGRVYQGLGRMPLALTWYQAALLRARRDGDTRAEVAALVQIGATHEALGAKQKALQFYSQALTRNQILRDRRREVVLLNGIGMIYSDTGKNEDALVYYNKSLTLSKEIQDRRGEALALSNIGIVYDDTADKRKALALYFQALPVFQEIGDKRAEASTLNNIGKIHADIGDAETALEFYGKSYAIEAARKNTHGMAVALNNIGEIHAGLGNPWKAIEYFERSLPLFRQIQDPRTEAMTLINLGQAYRDIGEQQKALSYYKTALPLSRKGEDPRWEARGLTKAAVILSDLNEAQQARRNYEDSIALSRKAKDVFWEAETLTQFGGLLQKLGERDRALDSYAKSLLLRRQATDYNGEAATLYALMLFWERPSPSLAIFFGKSAVNLIQFLRSKIKSLDQESQRGFLRSREPIYRKLSELLISQDRIMEAQQVIEMLKEEEYVEYICRGRAEEDDAKRRSTLTPREIQVEKDYGEIVDRISEYVKELEELNRVTQPGLAQARRRAELERHLTLASERFQLYFARLQKEFGDTRAAGERLTEIDAGEGFQDTLRALGAGTAAIYTVVGEQKYSVIFTPAAGPRIAAESLISRVELNKKIFALQSALRNPRVDPRPLAAELYDILIDPIAKNLEGDKVDTLMFSLDGALRYLPMAALYDKRRDQYLIERYRVVLYTPAGATDLKNAARRGWRGLGFGVSKAIENSEVGRFSPLPGVPTELRGVIRKGGETEGVIQGEVYLDEQFTEARFVDALRPREYPLIHIASHFAFRPGDSLKSFLLLGDGKGLTLEKIQKNPFPLFSGVDLLALSACDTGIGEKDNEGREVEGFGVLAQKKGAKAVLATLWAVADGSTARLMREFYRLREAESGMNKAEALRQAQLRFLRGESAAGTGEDRSSSSVTGKAVGSLPKFEPSPNAPLAHPYFWAPFVLIGNWQ